MHLIFISNIFPEREQRKWKKSKLIHLDYNAIFLKNDIPTLRYSIQVPNFNHSFSATNTKNEFFKFFNIHLVSVLCEKNSKKLLFHKKWTF